MALDFSEPAAGDAAEQSWFALSRFGVGAHVGTLGLGGHVTYDVKPWFYVKADLSGLGVDVDDEYEGVDYTGKLDVFAGGLTANFRPFHKVRFVRGFRVTAGAYIVDMGIDLTARGSATPGDTIEVGGADFNVGANDGLDGNIDLSGFSPYLGLGWDWGFGSESGLGVSLDLGVVFTGSADVDLVGVGVLAGQAAVDAELAELRDDVDEISIFPLLRISATYRF